MKKLLKTLSLLLYTLGLHISLSNAQNTSFYVDGLEWYCSSGDSVDVCASVEVETLQDLNYYRFNILINNVSERQTFLFNEGCGVRVHKKDKITELKVWKADEFNKRMQRLDMLTEGLDGFNAGAGGKKTREEKQLDNIIMAYNTSVHESNRKMVKAGYLKKNTVFPGDCVSGYIMSERKKGDTVELELTISGQRFNFTWDM